MSPYDWNREIADIHRRMYRWLENLAPRRVSSCFSGERCFTPAADIHETEKAYHVFVDLAGVDSSMIEVIVEGNILHLKGSRRRPQIDSCTGVHQLEIDFGPFQRVFRFPLELDADSAHSEYQRGFLEVVLPKSKRPQSVQVSLKSK